MEALWLSRFVSFHSRSRIAGWNETRETDETNETVFLTFRAGPKNGGWQGGRSAKQASAVVAVSYYEQDGLRSITSLTNSSGALADAHTYDSFGNLTASTGTVLDPLRKPQSCALRQPV
jgi:hypothetical protein